MHAVSPAIREPVPPGTGVTKRTQAPGRACRGMRYGPFSPHRVGGHGRDSGRAGRTGDGGNRGVHRLGAVAGGAGRRRRARGHRDNGRGEHRRSRERIAQARRGRRVARSDDWASERGHARGRPPDGTGQRHGGRAVDAVRVRATGAAALRRGLRQGERRRPAGLAGTQAQGGGSGPRNGLPVAGGEACGARGHRRSRRTAGSGRGGAHRFGRGFRDLVLDRPRDARDRREHTGPFDRARLQPRPGGTGRRRPAVRGAPARAADRRARAGSAGVRRRDARGRRWRATGPERRGARRSRGRRAPSRRRQHRDPGRGAQPPGRPARRRVELHPRAHDRRRTTAVQQLRDGSRRRAGPLQPRALGRRGLPRRPGRERDPAGCADRVRVRGVRGYDRQAGPPRQT